jgi:DNA-binding response OmpR family regulator
MKLSAAVKALGFASDMAKDGPQALQMMKGTRYSLVLLDILMPDMDGFEVMSFMKRDRQLSDIPIIVISALEGEMPSVVKAIEMGAEDFLPKHFDKVLLAARLDSALEIKRARDREHEQRHHVEKLIQAAAILENEIVDPDLLQLHKTSARRDDIGKLARVFMQMTRRIHGREALLHKRIQMIRNGSLILGIGVVGGSVVALASAAVQQQPQPLGIVLWINIFSACICLPIAAYRQSIRKPTRAILSSVLLLGIFTLLLQVPVFWATQLLPVSVIVMIMAIESLLIIGLLSASRALRVSPIGITTTLIATAAAGVAITVVSRALSVEQITALAVLSIAPLAIAVRTLYWQRTKEQNMDTFAQVGSAAFVAAVLVAPFAMYFGDLAFIMPQAQGDLFILIIALLTVVTAATTAMRITLDQLSGPLFAVQASLAIMVAGLVWSYLLHTDLLPAWGWLIFALFALVNFQSAALKHEDGDQQKTKHKSDISAAPRVDIELH